jgi:hypothetical protein
MRTPIMSEAGDQIEILVRPLVTSYNLTVDGIHAVDVHDKLTQAILRRLE